MNDLTTTEQASLERYERVIEKGLASFYEVGSALLTIRDSRLYRGTHGTFEGYCQDRWQMSRPRAYQLIEAAKVKDNLSTIVDIPVTESQARPLTSLPPDKQSEAWQQAVDTAPDGKVTAAHVASVVKGMTEAEEPKPAPKPQEPSDAMAFAAIAISQLERIHPKDPERSEALVKVERWIQKHKGGK